MRTLVIVQARMGGTRCPGKIQTPIAGMSVLEHVVRRARHGGYAVVIASPPSDGPALAWTQSWRRAVPDKRGMSRLVPIYFADVAEDDVLARLALTAKWANNMESCFGGGLGYGCIVRVTADCPWVPVDGIDAVAEAVTSGEYDYCETRSDPSTRPNGIDVQAMRYELLMEAHALATRPEDREHITGAMVEYANQQGRIAQIEGMGLDRLPGLRLTLDTPDDALRYQTMAAHMTVDPTAGRPTLAEIVGLHRRMPELFEVANPAPMALVV